MRKFIIRIAELNVEINCKYDLTFNLCKNYIVESGKIDIIASSTEEKTKKFSDGSSLEMGEFISLYDSIASQLTSFNRVLIHGSAIEYHDLAYLFLADSGIGKSTHTKLWLENIKGISVINGDKPILDDMGNVYGTPWAGKERWNTNKSSKVAGIVLLYRDSYNHIEETTYSENIADILNQIYKDSKFDISMSIIDKAFKNVPIYKLGCTIDSEAAHICFDKIIKDKNENK